MDLVSYLAVLLPTVVGGLSAFGGIRAYMEQQKLRRKETIFPLVEELHKSKSLERAQMILDDRVLRYKKRWNKSVEAYGIIWDEITGDYKPLKNPLQQDKGLAWIEDQDFIKSDDKYSVTIQDKQHFLSIIDNERLPYCVDVETLDRMTKLEGSKHKYTYIHYLYADISERKVNQLGRYFHKSCLKHVLRKHSSSPIMDAEEDQIRRSFDSLFRFFERIGYLDEGLGLLRKEELGFFKIRAEKLIREDSIKEYVEHYGFNLAL